MTLGNARILRRKADIQARLRDAQNARHALYMLQLHPASKEPVREYSRAINMLDRECGNYLHILETHTEWVEDYE
jgi:hypothetical protein